MRRAVIMINILMFSVWSICAQMNENVVVLNMQTKDSETQMIDYYGRLIKTFSPEERPKTEDKKNIKFLTFSLERSFDFHDFSDGYLPVVKDKKWKFYNNNGEMVMDFGDKFYSFTTPIDGIYRAYEKSSTDGRISYKVVYIDQNFEEMFSGQRFWQASNMLGGYAFVQLNDKNGPWSVLESKSGKIRNLDPELSKSIRSIEKDSKGNGIVRYKSSSRKDFIDKNGILVNPKEDEIELTKEQKSINENTQICVNNHSFALNHGSGINEVKLDRKSENKELVFGIVFNHKFIPDWMNLKDEEFFYCEVSSEKYFGGLILDTLNKAKKFKYYDFLEKKNVLITDKQIEYIFGDRFFVTTPSPTGYGSKLVEILDPQGNIIYSLSPKKRIFNGIESTLKFDEDEIYKLYLSKDENLISLKNYEEIRFIEFDKFTFTQLPSELSNFTHLESLKLKDCDNLKELPKWLNSANNLKTLDISNCKNLKNIEDLIENSESLEFVRTQNYYYKSGFGKRIKNLKPNLKFDNSYLRSKKFK